MITYIKILITCFIFDLFYCLVFQTIGLLIILDFIIKFQNNVVRTNTRSS